MAEWREEGMGRNGGKGREYEMNMKESIRKGMEWKGKEYEGMKVEWMSDLVHWGSCCFTKMIVVVSKNQHQKQVDGRNPAPVDIVKYPIIYINFNNMPRCFFFRDFWTKKQNEAAMFQEKRVPHLHINSAPPWGGEKKILFLLQKSWRSGFSLDVSKLIDEVDEVDSPKTSHQDPMDFGNIFLYSRVGGFSPTHLKNYVQVKWDHETPRFEVNMKNILDILVN